MAYLNMNISRTAYNDAVPTPIPTRKLFDYTTSIEGLVISRPCGTVKLVYPGQTELLDSTSRTLTYDATSEFDVSIPSLGYASTTRLRWTGVGTHPGFRTYRSTLGGADTVVNVDRVSNTSLQITYDSGTALDFSTCAIGDDIYFQISDDVFTNPFTANLQGQYFKVTKVDPLYVVIRDNGLGSNVTGLALGADYDSAFRIFSNSGVQAGDKVSFSSTANMYYDNAHYVVEVTAVTDRDIYYINPYSIPETTIIGANAMSIYNTILNFVMIEATGPIKLRLGSSATEQIQLKEFANGQAFFMGTLQLDDIFAINDTDSPIEVIVQTCSISEGT